MHRTQVIIDEKHYAFLKKKSEQERKSISQVLREILDIHAKKSKVYSLSSLAGIIKDGEPVARDHDKWIYEGKG